MKTEKSIGKLLSWLETMKQPDGYAGPVSHYWSDCLGYIGPGTDWRYEGLITGFIKLHEKTGNKDFADRALECGDFIIRSQKESGAFENSGFESNPSLNYSYQPHEMGACIGLLELAKWAKKANNIEGWKKYLDSARRNIDGFFIRNYYDGKDKCFYQYERWRAEKVVNKYVPNKIATACEALLLLYEITKEKKYFDYAHNASRKIIENQDKGEFKGGIYQANDKDKIVAFYTARCIPALMKIYGITKEEEYLDAATDAADFVENLWVDGKGFRFGFVADEGSMKRVDYPYFLAGSADIIRALKISRESDGFKSGKYVKWLLESQDRNGGFRTAYGTSARNKEGIYDGKPSWRDVLHVVGWNDKVLRLLSDELEEGSAIGKEASGRCEIECSDGDYYEDEKIIRVSGKSSYAADKKQMFSGSFRGLKKVACDFASDPRDFVSLMGRLGLKISGVR